MVCPLFLLVPLPAKSIRSEACPEACPARVGPVRKIFRRGLRRYSNEFVPLCAIWLKENFI